MVALIMLLSTDVHSNVFESFQENMDRHEQQGKTIRKLKKQLYSYMKKVGDFEGRQIDPQSSQNLHVLEQDAEPRIVPHRTTKCC